MFIKHTFYFLVLILLSSCGPKQQGPKPGGAIPVRVQAVSESNAVYYDEYPATVTALNQIEVRAQINGYINGIHFKEGDQVKKGQKLYSIDQQQYEASYQQALANVAVQEANLVKAKKDVDRYRVLIQHDAIARQLVDNAEANYVAAERQVDAAKATAESMQTNVRYSTIFAPFDGTIGISIVKLGAAVSAGQTVLNTISSDNPMTADFSVDQREIYHFTQLQAKLMNANDSTFRLAFNGEVYPYLGKIRLIDRAVNSQTGTIIVRLEFPNPDRFLRVGMSGTVRILNNRAQKSILIPYKAVTEQLGEYFVYVVKLDSNKVTQQRVLLGKQVGRDIVIKKGLQDGQTIVVEGVQNLREGTAISIPDAKVVADQNKPTK